MTKSHGMIASDGVAHMANIDRSFSGVFSVRHGGTRTNNYYEHALGPKNSYEAAAPPGRSIPLAIVNERGVKTSRKEDTGCKVCFTRGFPYLCLVEGPLTGTFLGNSIMKNSSRSHHSGFILEAYVYRQAKGVATTMVSFIEVFLLAAIFGVAYAMLQLASR